MRVIDKAIAATLDYIVGLEADIILCGADVTESGSTLTETLAANVASLAALREIAADETASAKYASDYSNRWL